MRSPANEADPGISILPALPNLTDAFAFAINNQGWIVGRSALDNAATLWNAADQTAYDLNALTTALRAGCQLISATDINDQNVIITIAAGPDGEQLALLTPTNIPEPATLLVFASPLLLHPQRRCAQTNP